jgi:CTP:molybdopterin cytidylyltransferase MocA
MADSVAGVVLAAGRGERLRPLTLLRPKALCPVAGVPLVDHALARLDGTVSAVAVNVHHGRSLMEEHLHGRVHLSVEEGVALGTAGALGLLRPWIDGRATVVLNVDAWTPARIDPLLEGWDGERIRLLLVGDDELRPRSTVAGALLPWADVARLAAEPTGLWEASWRDAAAAGRIEVVRHDGAFGDCGTPAGYLATNLLATGGASAISPGADVQGEVVRSVVWPGGVVRPGEVLVDGVRYSEARTLLVRPGGGAVTP